MSLDDIVSVPLKNLPRYISGYDKGIIETNDNGKKDKIDVGVDLIGYLLKMLDRGERKPNSDEEIKILEVLQKNKLVNYSKNKDTYSLATGAHTARYSLMTKKP